MVSYKYGATGSREFGGLNNFGKAPKAVNAAKKSVSFPGMWWRYGHRNNQQLYKTIACEYWSDHYYAFWRFTLAGHRQSDW